MTSRNSIGGFAKSINVDHGALSAFITDAQQLARRTHPSTAASRQILVKTTRISPLVCLYQLQASTTLPPAILTDLVASLLKNTSPADKISLLSITDVNSRMKRVHELMKEQLTVL